MPAAEIDPLYRRLRWQIFIGIFFGYAAYYLVRKNFALAMPYLVEQGFSRGDLGFALSGISIAYGFSKFIMGSVSDRSNPRIFLPAGLILAALVMLGDGVCTLGDLQHYGDVRAAVPLRLVPGDGLAAVRADDGALVVAERTRRHCLGVELRA
ncbi:G-3-P permease [Raoultella planticola]|uniref:G-3-P permease n=1 Tax=Raoultella planticola TaxID=575 RepID=A0A485ASK8_RAOPL|nr:G-3-P permease [Raoultella planticola]